jgi:DNA-directed RNA polymerase alpha subunit
MEESKDKSNTPSSSNSGSSSGSSPGSSSGSSRTSASTATPSSSNSGSSSGSSTSASVSSSSPSVTPKTPYFGKSKKIIINNIDESAGVMKFYIENVNVSIINAIRRTILADIPTVVIRSAQYDKSDVIIKKNTTRLNNEIIKHRLSSIPIHIKNIESRFSRFMIELDVKNDTDEIQYVTTKDFKIKDTEADRYLSEKSVLTLFPPDPITGDNILFVRLLPSISPEIPGDRLQLEAKLSLGTAREDSVFNVASTCSYSMAVDRAKQENIWKQKEKELREQGFQDSDIVKEKQNWLIHDGRRIIKPDSFEFILETIGVFSNSHIISTACEILIDKLQKVIEVCENETLPVTYSQTVMLSYDIKLENEDYTIGKAIEYALYDLFYLGNNGGEQVISYVGFRKTHPHDNYSIVRLSFKDDKAFGKPDTYKYVKSACEYCIDLFNSIQKEF